MTLVSGDIARLAAAYIGQPWTDEVGQHRVEMIWEYKSQVGINGVGMGYLFGLHNNSRRRPNH